MKKLVIGLLGVGAMACQPQATTPVQSVAVATPAAVPTPIVVPPKAAQAEADTLTADMRALLRTYNLAPLWSGRNPEGLPQDSITVLDGFLGPDHYRISVVFTQVRHDSANPALFHVNGKSHYKRLITPFTGVFRVRQLADLDRHFLDVAPEDSLAQGYTATADFMLSEIATAPAAGKFVGTGVLDFYITPRGALNYAQNMLGEEAPARGQGLLFKGSWTGQPGHPTKKLLLARSVFSIAPDVYKDFSIGDRSGEINPKYAKLGWNTYWENDEWWADSPRPSLNL